MNAGNSDNFKNYTGLWVFSFLWLIKGRAKMWGMQLQSLKGMQSHSSEILAYSVCWWHQVIAEVGFGHGITLSFFFLPCPAFSSLYACLPLFLSAKQEFCLEFCWAHLFVRSCLLCAHFPLCNSLPFQRRIFKGSQPILVDASADHKVSQLMPLQPAAWRDNSPSWTLYKL